jgi:nucleotide-binding universal stress UspA family protein
MILICYDGSDDAKAAIEDGSKLLKSESATVLTVWQPFVEVLAHVAPFGIGGGIVDIQKIDQANREGAEERAEEGARLARAGGLEAKPLTVEAATPADAILAQAEALGASAILMGCRGLTALKSLLLGSVSHAVIQHADRTVIVVPSPAVAASRADARRPTQEQ